MKKSIFLFFAAILCAMSANAKNVTKPRIYYDNSKTSYSSVSFVIGHSSYSRCYKLTKISNTNLWYRYLNGTGNDTWTDATQIAVFGVDWDSSEGSPISNRRNYTGDKYTNTLTLSSDLSSGKVYLVTASGNKSTTSIALKSGGYTDLNYTQTVEQQLTTDGTTYNASTEAIATVKVSAYKLNNYNTTESNNSTIASGNSSATCSAARTATVTYTVSGVNSAYTFVGWYDGDTQKSTSSTYTYEATEAKTITARFAVATEEEHEVTITYVCGSNTVSAATSAYVGVETEKTFTAPTVTGYQFKNWTVGAGMTLKVGTENDATITVVTKSASSNYTLVANYEEVMETVYFINTGKWSVVNLHRWGGTATETSWPGEAMTKTGEKIGDYDVYSFTARQGAFANVIFTNKNTGSDQTDDLVWTAGEYYIYNYGGKSGWYTKAEAEELLVVPVVTYDIVVKAVAPDVWDSGTISIHYWGDGISATPKPVATEKDGNWNKYTIKNVPEGTSVNVIFVNGADWSSNANQTANITGITEDKCFQISAKNKDGEGKCTTTVVDCNATIEPEVKPEDIYTVVGSSAELGLEWNPAKEANDMEKQGDGSYKKVYSNVELTSDVEWKIAKNDNWWNETPLENKADNGNSVLVIAKSGIYNVTFTLSADLKTAHAEAELLEETNTVADCFVSGNAALTGGAGWAGNEFKMEYDPATETYSYTLTGLAAETAYELQVVLGGNWYGYEKLQTIPTGVENKEGHIAFTLAEAGDVTITYHATNGINLTGNFAVPTPATYTVVGHKDILGESWNLASTINIMTETDGNYTLTKTGLKLEARDYEYKVVKNGAYGEGEYPNGTNEKVTIAENGVYTIVYTYKVGTSLEAVATRTGDYTPDKATYTVAGDIALCGTNWKADDETNDMTDNGDGTFTWAKTGIELVTNVSFKVVKNHDFENESYPSDNWVIDIEGSNGVYDITITFTESNKEIKVEKTRTGDLPKKTLVYTVTVPAGTKQCYIAGVMNEWTAQPMTPAGTNKFSISIDNVTIATGYKYTCKDGEDTWAYVEKKNGNGSVDNRTYNANDVVERWNRIDISDGENAAIIGSHAGKGKVEVYVDRELKAGQLYTISLPFAVADADGLFGSETVVYEYADLKYENDEYALYFDNTKNAMEAGKPYLVQPGSDINGFEYNSADVVFEQKVISKTVNNTTISMESVLSVTAGATTNGKYWLASDNCLYNVSTALKSLRAVFDIQSTKANVRARVAFGENVETGVDNIVTTDAPVKVIKNGQLIIIRDGVKYNVQGQKL